MSGHGSPGETPGALSRSYVADGHVARRMLAPKRGRAPSEGEERSRVRQWRADQLRAGHQAAVSRTRPGVDEEGVRPVVTRRRRRQQRGHLWGACATARCRATAPGRRSRSQRSNAGSTPGCPPEVSPAAQRARPGSTIVRPRDGGAERVERQRGRRRDGRREPGRPQRDRAEGIERQGVRRDDVFPADGVDGVHIQQPRPSSGAIRDRTPLRRRSSNGVSHPAPPSGPRFTPTGATGSLKRKAAHEDRGHRRKRPHRIEARDQARRAGPRSHPGVTGHGRQHAHRRRARRCRGGRLRGRRRVELPVLRGRGGAGVLRHVDPQPAGGRGGRRGRASRRAVGGRAPSA